ncbi:sigma-70 family RNA polymerase sigma factor [Rhodococcus sp. ABRD24]|uniref:RNA polymerase sigma factor SigJ n=1 Tax=Rhodococcus sp. ABRD24 TaxID=2507582 RepID=UPI00103CA54C|nr:RNA polymerase sigma factor SigJ [Rhodococcus sp. ABRD24]QBJ96574.1 sigma-70 family RNA polymerase sigma factor [Rhodococcus sp. ABRD24]
MNLAPESTEYKQLFGMAYRMLGSAHDAEDAVQDAVVRWQSLGAAERAAIREPIAWMTTVVSRICLDQLGSARARRESYAGIWLPEPVPGAVGPGSVGTRSPDPADAVTLDESVSVALMRAMESLTPGERVALILHDVFGMPFAEIADVVGRTPDACRQLASTARRHLRSSPRFQADDEQRRQVVFAFAAACSTGDIDALMDVLAPGVVSRADGGGMAGIARVPVMGADRVARYLLGIVGMSGVRGVTIGARFEIVNNRTGVVISFDDRVAAVLDLAVADGRVHEIAIIMNPDKLRAWAQPD